MNTTENIDDYLKKAIKDSLIEKPDDGFVSSVMDKIDSEIVKKEANVQSQPLISLKGWTIISAVVVLIFSLLLLSGPTTIDLSLLTDYFDKIQYVDFELSISWIFITGLSVLVFFFLINIFIVSRKLTNRYLKHN